MTERGSHAGRWIAVAAVLAALVAIALLVASVHTSRRGLDERFNTRGQLAADFTSAYVAQVARREQRVAEQHLVGDVSASRFSEVVTTGDFAAAVLLDGAGGLLQVHPPADQIERTRFAERYRHLRAAVDGDVAVSDIVPSASSAEPIIAVAAPFEAEGERRVYSAGFSLTDTPLQVFIKNAVPISGSAGYLVDGSGEVIASSNDRIVGEALTDVIPDLAGTPQAGSGDATIEGDESHYVARSVEGTRWRILLTVPHDTLYQPLRATTYVQAGALVLMLVLAWAVAVLVRRILRTEQRLTYKVQQLEVANGALDAFSHTLVHDLRNPLTVIGGFAQTLGTVLDDADDRVREMMGHIESSAQRMSGLIEDVLALATASRPAERVPCDLRHVITEAARENAAVDVETGWLPEIIDVDRAGLFRCVQNLLENTATHAADAQGRARVRVSADETPWAWRIFFDDDGPGIDEADQERVFQAFERGAGSLPGTGTGLGLSIIGAFAQAHGGSATVGNAAGGGARFTVEIAKPSSTSSNPSSAPRVEQA